MADLLIGKANSRVTFRELMAMEGDLKTDTLPLPKRQKTNVVHISADLLDELPENITNDDVHILAAIKSIHEAKKVASLERKAKWEYKLAKLQQVANVQVQPNRKLNHVERFMTWFKKLPDPRKWKRRADIWMLVSQDRMMHTLCSAGNASADEKVIKANMTEFLERLAARGDVEKQREGANGYYYAYRLHSKHSDSDVEDSSKEDE